MKEVVSREGAPFAPLPTEDGLAVGDPAQAGLRLAPLQALIERLRADSYPDLRGVLVWCAGRQVLEAYFNGARADDPHDLRSVGKSVTGALVGIAVDQRAIAGLDCPVLRFFPHQAVPVSPSALLRRVTVRHLLEMRSGFDADEDRPDSTGFEDKLAASRDWLRFALQVPVVRAPGSAWAYASLNTMLLGRIVERATGKDLQDFADQFLFGPLGITAYRWARAPDGHIVGQGNLSLRLRDALKIGVLYLRRGRWQDRQLIAPHWVEESTRMRTPLALEHYVGYGYQWWRGEVPTGDRRVAFAFASGNGGQKVVVADSLDMVIVVASAAYGHGRGQQRSHAIIRDLLRVAARSAPSTAGELPLPDVDR